MRWEDQEINNATPAGEIPEVMRAHFSALQAADEACGVYFHIRQDWLDRLSPKSEMEEKKPTILRLCLYFRLMCGLGAGGGAYPELGVMHYWKDSKSRYAVIHVCPQNQWMQVMTIEAPAPIPPK